MSVSYSKDVLGVDKREASKFCLIKVHDEEFICWCQLGCLAGELTIEIANILSRFLEDIIETSTLNFRYVRHFHTIVYVN